MACPGNTEQGESLDRDVRRRTQISAVRPRPILFQPPVKPRPVKIPKVQDLIAAATGTTLVSPSKEVLRKLGANSIVVGVDIETADWLDQKNKPSRGQFGSTICVTHWISNNVLFKSDGSSVTWTHQRRRSPNNTSSGQMGLKSLKRQLRSTVSITRKLLRRVCL